jgi:transcriptional regulator with XRE-family HTH domain
VSRFDPPMDDNAVTAILASIGGQVRDARLARQWFLSDLADRVGFSSSVLCRLELARREPSINQLITVCAALAHRPSELFRTAEDEVFPYDPGPWRSSH